MECKRKPTLLSALEEHAILWVALIDRDELGSSQKLHHKARSDDGADTELHQSTAIRGKDNTSPVERIRRLRRLDSEQRDLTANLNIFIKPSQRQANENAAPADQENEQCDQGPHGLLLDRHLGGRCRHLRQEHGQRLDQVEESRHVGLASRWFNPNERKSPKLQADATPASWQRRKIRLLFSGQLDFSHVLLVRAKQA